MIPCGGPTAQRRITQGVFLPKFLCLFFGGESLVPWRFHKQYVVIPLYSELIEHLIKCINQIKLYCVDVCERVDFSFHFQFERTTYKIISSHEHNARKQM